MSGATDDYLKKLRWNTGDRFLIEAEMVKRGGSFGGHGNGVHYHYREAMKALWPTFDWHEWSELLIECYCKHDEIGVMGPASSGKTYTTAAYGLTKFFIWPIGTAIIMSSTTRAGLQLRIWGAIKELFTKARERRPWLPGRIIESQFLLNGTDEDAEAKDFRDGIIGVACKVGGQFVGISNYIGLKRNRVLLVADEASLMGRGFLDSVANLRKNPSFQLIAMGNPKDRTDALGVICEPHPSIGGWDGHEYKETTRTWKTRAPNGVAIQLCGYDSPNYKFPKGLNPYRGIITPEQIENDLAYYGRDSLQFSMMNLGCMPKDGGNKRVITLTICEQNRAFDAAIWASKDKLQRCVGIDAAYSGVGGDRCVLTDLTWGPTIDGAILIALSESQTIIPVSPTSKTSPEDQIAEFTKNYCETRQIKPENVAFDSTGRGTLMSSFARLWSPSVVPVEFGGLPSDERAVRSGDQQTEREAYGKQVTALWYASRLVIESGQMRGLSRELVEEGSQREWGISKSGKIDVEPKDKTKERMGRSPDLWDSLVVAIEVARRRGFSIAYGSKIGINNRKMPAWLKNKAHGFDQFRSKRELSYS